MADKKISALTGAATPLAGSEVLPIVQSGATVKVSVDNLTAGKTVNTQNIIATVADDAYALAGNATTGSVRVIPYVAGYAGSGIVTYSGGYAGYGPLTIDSSVIRFYTLGNERANIDATGNFNLGSGNVVIGTAGKGIDFSANTHAPGMTSELLTWYEEGVFTPTVFGTGTAGTGTYTFQVGSYVRIGKVVQFQASLAWSAHTGTGDFGGVGGLPFSSASTADNYSIPSIYVSDLALTASNTIQGFIGPSTATIALRQVPVGGGTASVIPFDTSVSALLITGSYIAA
jgi:hypothetical protein